MWLGDKEHFRFPVRFLFVAHLRMRSGQVFA
jgi:hypothetical protein